MALRGSELTREAREGDPGIGPQIQLAGGAEACPAANHAGLGPTSPHPRCSRELWSPLCSFCTPELPGPQAHGPEGRVGRCFSMFFHV